MDYREVENRLARNRDMLKERERDRLVKQVKQANKPQMINVVGGLKAFWHLFMKRNRKPRLDVQLKPQPQIEQS